MAKFCTNCGAPMEEGQNACTSCGNVVGTVTANQSTTQRTAAPGRILWLMMGFRILRIS